VDKAIFASPFKAFYVEHWDYDIIVVGAGHAGCEAAAAAAHLGSSVLLVTMNMQTIAQMSIQPWAGLPRDKFSEKLMLWEACRAWYRIIQLCNSEC
jgi:glycine/D-amino acid oxidase-like deaminating enzyme